MNKVSFLPEGFAETTLLLFFKVPIKLINTSSGCHGVAKSMLHQVGDFHKVLIGIVDDDKHNVPSYFNDFKEIHKENGLVLKQKPKTNHYLIIISPEFEKWILDIAKSVNVNPKDFSLPTDPGELHDITRRENLSKNINFSNFFKSIRGKNPPEFECFQNIIDRFYQNKFSNNY